MKQIAEHLNMLMKQHNMSQRELAENLGVVPSVVSMICSGRNSITYVIAKKLNRLFKTAYFSPTMLLTDGSTRYNLYGNDKTNKANEFSTGTWVTNLFNNQIQKIIQVKWNQEHKEWLYKTAENPNEWISEYQLDKAESPEPTPEQAFLDLIKEQAEAKAQAETQPEKPINTVKAEEEKPKDDVVMSLGELNRLSQKDNLKKVILNIVEQLLTLI